MALQAALGAKGGEQLSQAVLATVRRSLSDEGVAEVAGAIRGMLGMQSGKAPLL